MANDYGLPRQQSPFLDAKGEPTTAWYNWLKKLETLYSGGDAGLQAQITQIAYILGSPDGTVGNIPPLNGDFLSINTIVKGAASVASFGSLSGGLVTLTLVNDTEIPEPDSYYGTDELSAKGWHPFPNFDSNAPYFIPETETYTVPLYKQALFTMPIDVEGLLVVDGFLVEVD